MPTRPNFSLGLRCFFSTVVMIFLFFRSEPARADWTWNLGYQNPAGSTVGVNFLYLGSKWGFEAGIGWIDINSTNSSDKGDKKNDAGKDGEKADDNDSTRATVGGDLDLKYFFSASGVRPFLQGGLGVGIGGQVGDNTGASAGAGGGFAGAGLLFGSKSVYGYASYNINEAKNAFLQAGLGFDL